MHAQETRFERTGGAESAPYEEVISFYRELDRQNTTIQMEQAGSTDAAYPLHVVYYSNDANFHIKQWKADGKVVLLINNGIHPGEPDGIDACMMLLRDAASGKITIPDNVVLAVIPVFNIGGALNRSKYSRVNQNGPLEYGFRGNSQNLDLNRDFIKMEAKETQSLVKLFHKLDPDLFIDNHVSNGADYQHVMTLLSTQYNKLGGAMGKFLNETFEPMIYKDMQQRGYDLVPYVNHWGQTPDKGWVAFHEGPRFTSGFATLFHTYAFVPETHMLKPYKQRVESTYALMESFIKLASENAKAIHETREQQKKDIAWAQKLPIPWQSDTTKHSTIMFKGYEAAHKPSEVSELPRLYYDRNKPYTKQIPSWNYYSVKQTATVPQAYIIPHGWNRVINRLEMNGVQLQQVHEDSVMRLTVYYIDKYETNPKPFEGHYLHSNVQLRTEHKNIKLLKGDYVVYTNQPARRYLVETLEPNAPDAFFAWGFFDAILQQKGGYSDYVFEDDAAALLSKDPSLREKLEQRKKADAAFAGNSEAQLDFVYHNSVYNEEEYMRYPVYRLE